ncbi:MAG: 50S ribosomal protein L22 [Candidatus Moranbacteria bacterium]|nr:50S ribosomal protein L22 [Candidatus Moranbacteria bacterium]
MSEKVTAQLNNLRVSPRKVRLVTDQVRGLNVDKALVVLEYNLKKPADIVAKLVRSAVANAENNFKLKKDNLVISEIQVGEGKTLKRWMPRAYGRASKILKRTSKIRVVLSEKVEVIEKNEKKVKVNKKESDNVKKKLVKNVVKKSSKKVSKKSVKSNK